MTIGSAMMLFLLIAIMIGLVTSFYSLNSSAQQQLSYEGQRSAEQITLISFGVGQNNLLNATIANTGTIEVTIKALYKTLDGQVTYYYDPSINNPTIIQPGKNLTICFPSGVTLGTDEKIVAATSRGIKTIDIDIPKPTPTPSVTFDPTKYSYGNIELEWEKFECITWNGNNFNPPSQWNPGWFVSNPESYIAWRATIKNIGDKDIILNGNSSLTLDPTATDSQASPSKRSWFLYSDPTTQPQTALLPIDESVTVTFVWSDPYQQKFLGIYNQPSVCMVFLTFFGNNEDGTAYAQTVPFEAAVKVV